MSRLTDLIAQAKAKDAQLGADLEREFKALSSRRAFGLNFERHRPEAVELPRRPVTKGDKVRVLAPRGSAQAGDPRLWMVKEIDEGEGGRVARLALMEEGEPQTQEVAVDDLVGVAGFRDIIYPGLVSTGKVEREGTAPISPNCWGAWCAPPWPGASPATTGSTPWTVCCPSSTPSLSKRSPTPS